METETLMIRASLPWNDGVGNDLSEPYTEFATAIVYQAVKDYIAIIRKMWRHSGQSDTVKSRKLLLDKIEIEDFFHSGWFEALCDYDPDKVIWNCNRRAREQEEAAISKKNRKTVREKLKYKHMEENMREDAEE